MAALSQRVTDLAAAVRNKFNTVSAIVDLKAPLASPTFTGTVSGITKTMVGLGSVDNTADTAKPVSTAQQAAFDLKAPIANPTFTGTIGGISAAMVGLGNVNNTSDVNKPVSTAQQTAFDLKANLASPTFTGTVSGITKTMVGLGSVDNTADTAKPVSTAQQAALNLKIDLSEKGVASGVATLDGSGKVPTSQLPALAITQTYVVASQAAQLALSTQEGDVAIRSDLNKSFIKNSGTLGTMADWNELLTPTDNVLSVNGETGAVTITKSHIGLGSADNTSDANKPVSTAQQTALNLKANAASPAFTGTISASSGTLNIASVNQLGFNNGNTVTQNDPVDFSLRYRYGSGNVYDFVLRGDNGRVGIQTTNPYGILQVEKAAADNAAYKSIITITAHENTEGSADNYNGTSASFGTTFRRNWSGGSYTDLAGIYAYAQQNWRGGLVFRTKSDQTSGGSPVDRVFITPAGNMGVGIAPSAKFQVSGSGSSQLLIDYVNAGDNYFDATAAHYFRTNGYQTRMTIGPNGDVVANVAMQAPIFYDSNDTSYYIDPNNTGISFRARGNSFYGPNSSGRYLRIGGNGGATDESTVATSNGNLHIDCKSGYYTYLNYYSGNPVVAGADMRATIFYDNQDTSYYADPNGTSRFNQFELIGASQKYLHINPGNGYEAMVRYSGGTGSSWYAGKRTTGSLTGTENFHFYADAAGVTVAGITTTGGFYISDTFASGSHRAPIFYDLNNTAYYTDPASTSVLNGLTLGGRATTNAVYYQGFTLDANTMDGNSTGFTYSVNAPFTGPIVRLGEAAYSLQLNAPYGANGYMLAFRTRQGDASTFNPWQYPAVYGQNGAGVAALYATIYYDGNNSAYYTDPASTSVLNTLQFPPNTAQIAGNESSSYGSIAVRGSRNGWRGIHFEGGGNTPHLMFDSASAGNGGVYYETGGRWASYYNYGNNCWGFGDTSTFSGYNINAQTGIRSAGRVDGSIFYDVADTAFYFDGNGNSRIWTLSTYVGNETTGGANASNEGLVLRGNYNSNTWAHKFHKYDNGSGVPMYLSHTYGAGVWTPSQSWGIGTAYLSQVYGSFGADSIYTPIFYDRDNTGYYVNPASTTILNDCRAIIYYDQGNTGYYMQPSVTSMFNDLRGNIYYDRNNTGYYINGDSTSNLYAITAYSLQGNGNVGGTGSASWHPSGIYSAGHNWLYGGISLGGNSIGGVTAITANIFYDGDNTGYYVDPASTTYINQLLIQGGVAGLSNSSSFTEAALEVRERSFGGAQDITWATAPRIGFHWSGRVASQIAMDAYGVISILNNPGTDYEALRSGTFQATSIGVGTAASGTGGEIRATNNITAYYSDRRLKENITPIENPIAKILAISGVTFNSNDTAAEYGYTDKKRQVGVIAQEIAAVLPEIVVPAPFDIGKHEDGTEYSLSGENYQTVQYEKIVPLLIEAIKAQQALLSNMQEQINTLKGGE